LIESYLLKKIYDLKAYPNKSIGMSKKWFLFSISNVRRDLHRIGWKTDLIENKVLVKISKKKNAYHVNK